MAYINQIDDIIDSLLNTFGYETDNDTTYKIIVIDKQKNYVEYFEKINNFILEQKTKLHTDEVSSILSDKKNIDKIRDIIVKYICFYYFMRIGLMYSGTNKEYNNNLIQYSALYSNSGIKLSDFFSSENNYILINLFNFMKELKYFIQLSNVEMKNVDKIKFKNVISFITSLPGKLSFVTEHFFKEDKSLNEHNIIKMILLKKIYIEYDRASVLKILNENSEDNLEYSYIPVLIDNRYTFSKEYLEKAFEGTKNADIIAGFLESIYKNRFQITRECIDCNINTLFASPFISPIVDDFLRFHKDNYSVDTDQINFIGVIPEKDNTIDDKNKKKSNTRAQIVISTFENILDFNNERVKKNMDVIEKINKKFDTPLKYRRAVYYNSDQEELIEQKMLNQGGKANNIDEYELEMNYLNSHAYFSFRNVRNYGLLHTVMNDTFDIVRYCNIEYLKEQPDIFINTYTTFVNQTINVNGLCMRPSLDSVYSCSKKNQLIDIRQTEFILSDNSKVSSTNGYNMFIDLYKNLIIDYISFKKENDDFIITVDNSEILEYNKHLKYKFIYWIFDLSQDKYESSNYEINLETYENKEIVSMLNELYETLKILAFERIQKIITEYNYLKLDEILLIVQKLYFFLKQTINIDEISKNFITPYYENKLPYERSEFPILNDKVEKIKFTRVTDINKLKIGIDVRNYNNITEYISKYELNKNQTHNTEGKKFRCRHEFEWNKVSKTKKSASFEKELINFMSKFTTESSDTSYICNICGSVLPIKQYIQDGHYDNNKQMFVTLYSVLDVNLYEIREYSRYRTIIEYMDRFLNKISFVLNTPTYVGGSSSARGRRTGINKMVLDLFLLINSNDAKAKNISLDKYNIKKEFNFNLSFDLKDDIFDIREETISVNLNHYKLDVLNTYLILCFMMDVNSSIFTSFPVVKDVTDYKTYQFIKDKLFKNLFFKKSVTSDQLTNIDQTPSFGYMLYIVSYNMIFNKMWNNIELKDKPTNNQRLIIILQQRYFFHTFFYILNTILENAQLDPNNSVYKNFTIKFFSQIDTLFSKQELAISKSNTAIQPKPEKIFMNLIAHEKPSICKIPSLKFAEGTEYNDLLQSNYLIRDTYTDMDYCHDGKLHKWTSKKDKFYCKLCDVKFENIQNDNLYEKRYYFLLHELASSKKCISGHFHSFVNKKCSKCNRMLGDTYTKAQLDELQENMNKLNEEESIKNNNINSDMINQRKKSYEKEINEIEKLKKQFIAEYGDSYIGKYTIVTKKLFDLIKKYLGDIFYLDEKGLQKAYLSEGIYQVLYDHLGQKLKEPIIIYQKNTTVKHNNPNFKNASTINLNINKVEVYYNAHTYQMLGYKSNFNDYTTINNSSAYLVAIDSVYEKYNNLGLESKFIEIPDGIDKNTFALDSILARSSIYRTVIDKIKKICFSLKNNSLKKDIPTTGYMTFLDEQLDKIHTNFYQISNFIPDNFMENWEELKYLDEDNTTEIANFINQNQIYISSEMLNLHSNNYNLFTYYLSEQLSNLLEKSSDQNKLQMSKFIVNIIQYVYLLYNNSNVLNLFEVKKFNYLLDSTTIIQSKFNEYIGDADEDNEINDDEETYEENESRIDIKYDEDDENHEDQYELD